MNPIPALMLNGSPLAHNNRIPPTAERGTVTKTKAASRREPMARYNNKPIKASAKGTTRAKRALAFWRFSKAPPKCRV